MERTLRGASTTRPVRSPLHHLMLGHGLAVQALRATGLKARIGPAQNLTAVYPADDSDDARQVAARTDLTENRLYLEPILRGEYHRTRSPRSTSRTG